MFSTEQQKSYFELFLRSEGILPVEPALSAMLYAFQVQKASPLEENMKYQDLIENTKQT